MAMLYKIAKETQVVAGQSALARALNESPQTVKNWETRGISKGGAMKAQAVFGCNANDLLNARGGGAAPGLRADRTPAFAHNSATHPDQWIAAAIHIMQGLDDTQKQAMVARMREFRHYLGPPLEGQALLMAR